MIRVGCGALLLSLLLACNPHDEHGAGLASHDTLTSSPEKLAELITLENHGTWTERHETKSESFELHRLWVEARVANFRYHKRILVELDVPYEDGSRQRFLSPLSYAFTHANGDERWTSDALTIYPIRGSAKVSLHLSLIHI